MSLGLLTGRRIGNVQIGEPIGEGSMGIVYKGRHATLGIDVAIKVIRQQLIDKDQSGYYARFQREAQITARLQHPAIVRVIDFGECEGQPYLVMDYVDGFSLADLLAKREQPAEELNVLKVLHTIGNALLVAHKENIVHRDLKPGNILISRQGRLYVADMGLARDTETIALTQERIVVGSPAYMAPESFTAGATPDPRSDLYSLGVIAYHLAFNRMPYEGDIQAVMQGHLGARARWDLPTRCKKDVIAIIKRLMAYDRRNRYQSAADMLTAVRTSLGSRGHGSSSSRRGVAGTGSGSSIGDFSGFSRFLERRLGSETSVHQGGTVVHSTARERALVWLLLAAVVVLAVVAYRATGIGDAGKSDATAEPDIQAETTAP